LDTQSIITRTITVAGGRFTPGHLGELTQHIPFEMVDEALAATRTTQTRPRDPPSRGVVYPPLAARPLPEIEYPGVWAQAHGRTSGSAHNHAHRPRTGLRPSTSTLAGPRVRVIEAQITIATTAGGKSKPPTWN
jgi:Insertion element 4 transposase N-terminal